MIEDPPSLAQRLADLAQRPDSQIELAEAALMLGALRHGGADLDPYREALAGLRDEVAAEKLAPESSAAERGNALRRVIAARHGFAGDDNDYDNLDNADLLRVIDRKRGLPVALGILWLQTGWAQGWNMAGLTFPAHFLLRIDDDAGGRVIIDPFNGGALVDAAGLRNILKSVTGDGAELGPAHYAEMSRREILLRLQNNIKFRLLRAGQLDRAAEIVGQMLLFAPDQLPLWREAGMIHLRLGNLQAAIGMLDYFVQHAPNGPMRHRVSVLLQDLRERLN